jgi:hypothetical protein
LIRHVLPALVALALLAPLLPGCAKSFPTVDTKMEGARAVFDMPPKELVAQVKQVLSSPPLNIGVAEESNGSILSGYQRFPGEFRVARRWQEQTRYRVTVIPDFDQPTRKATLTITESTEQRAAEGMKWESIDVLPRPERAAELLRQIQQRIGSATATTAPVAQ